MQQTQLSYDFQTRDLQQLKLNKTGGNKYITAPFSVNAGIDFQAFKNIKHIIVF